MTAKHLVALVTVALAMVAPTATATAAPPAAERNPTRLVTGLEGGSGSTVGPDGALYVTESAAGKVSRVDPKTGNVTTFASGLPKALIGFGGAMDVEFVGRTAYVLVSVVDPDVGGSDIDGIYRVDGPQSFTVVADIGAFALANPPHTPFDLPRGVQYALESYRGGFVVTDGHHNRVLSVTRDGEVSERIAFGNIVPTGLAVRGSKVYMAEAGPVPHLPEDGNVVSFGHEGVHRHGGRLRRSPPRRRGVRSRSHALRALAGRLRRRPGWFAGVAKHRQPRAGKRGRQLQHRRGWLGPAHLARVHREHRLRGHPQRGDLEARQLLVPAPRHIALNEPPSIRSCGAARTGGPPRNVQSDLSDLVPGRYKRLGGVPRRSLRTTSERGSRASPH